MTSSIENSIAQSVSSRRAPGDGQIATATSVACDPTGVSDVRDQAADAGALAAMRAQFLSDFSNGRMGQHHNTFQHRARILRQLDAANRREPA